MLLANRLNSQLDPWRLINELEHQWTAPIAQWLGTAANALQDTSVRSWVQEGAAIIDIDVPGYGPDDVDVSIHDGQLIVETRESEQEEAKGAQYHLRELSPFTRRTFRLPFDVDVNRTEAEVRQGVLRIKIYETESSKPKRVVVKGE